MRLFLNRLLCGLEFHQFKRKGKSNRWGTTLEWFPYCIRVHDHNKRGERKLCSKAI